MEESGAGDAGFVEAAGGVAIVIEIQGKRLVSLVADNLDGVKGNPVFSGELGDGRGLHLHDPKPFCRPTLLFGWLAEKFINRQQRLRVRAGEGLGGPGGDTIAYGGGGADGLQCKLRIESAAESDAENRIKRTGLGDGRLQRLFRQMRARPIGDRVQRGAIPPDLEVPFFAGKLAARD
jgi:hypothetical protein